MGPKHSVTHSFFPTSPNPEYTQCRLIISAQSPGAASREGSRFRCRLKQIKAPFFFYRRVLFGKYGRCPQLGCNCRRRGSVFVRLACSVCFGDSLPRPVPRMCFGSTGITGKLALNPRSPSSRRHPNIFSCQELLLTPCATPAQSARLAGSPRAIH